MLDIKFIRSNPDEVVRAMKTRGMDLDLSEFLSLDERRRKILSVQKHGNDLKVHVRNRRPHQGDEHLVQADKVVSQYQARRDQSQFSSVIYVRKPLT